MAVDVQTERRSPVVSMPIGERWRFGAMMTGSAMSLFIAAALTVVVVVTNGDLAPDKRLAEFTAEWTQDMPWVLSLADLIGTVTDVWPSTVVVVVGVVVLAALRHWWVSLFLVVCGVVGAVAASLLKDQVGRTRPPGALDYWHTMEGSFPSGHAMAGIYVYGALAIVLILFALRLQLRWLLWLGRLVMVFGIVIGLSRIVLGVHWATDVIGAWLLATAIVLFVVSVLRPDDRLLGRVLS